MKLSDMARELTLERLTPEGAADEGRDVRAGHASDLLSDVLAHAPRGGVLVTIQVHMNVIAVALHAELAAVVFASGMVPADEVRAKAAEEGIALYASSASAFDVVGRLYAFGVRGAEARRG